MHLFYFNMIDVKVYAPVLLDEFYIYVYFIVF